MSTLTKAITIAATAHAEQVDKAGQPYILHPLRVMLQMGGEESRIVAVLHDLLEDCPGWSFARLHDEMGFSPEIIAALDALTRRPGEEYPAFIQRCAGVPVARRVKIADLKDNMRGGLPPSPEHTARQQRYVVALERLLASGAKP